MSYFFSGMTKLHDERVRQVAVAAGILMTLTIVVPGLLITWRFLPGFLGEWVGTVMGVLTTPFIMETSFLILGLVIVILINHWRQQKEGDEFVYLEQVTGPDVPKDLPDQARWALYRNAPLDATDISLRDRAEGALAIGDHEAAAHFIAEMEPAELEQLEVITLRRDLALATGKTALAEEFEKRLRQQ
ncbi:MAG: hypothetical protein EOP88_08045 [Verrucomicrobiaceae bacterium]|nr:MAG: hypothetical protein EOP88_08045 [Verrucomicrobiaceae bacterium]